MLEVREKVREEVEKSELERAQNELETIRARTLYGLVKSLTVEFPDGHRDTKNVLFLRSKMAFDLSQGDIPRLLESMGLTDHKLVIHIPRSVGGLALHKKVRVDHVWKACAREYRAEQKELEGRPMGLQATMSFIARAVSDCLVEEDYLEIQNFFANERIEERRGLTVEGLFKLLQLKAETWASRLGHSDMDSSELLSLQTEAEWRLHSFVKEVLLPMAMRTKALFIVDGLEDSCVVAKALHICAEHLLQKGNSERPFSIIANVHLPDFETGSLLTTAKEPQPFTCQIRRGVDSWRCKSPRSLEDALGPDGLASNLSPAYTMYPYATHYLLHECGTSMRFFNDIFLEAISNLYQVIEVQATHPDFGGLVGLAQSAMLGFPVLLLDVHDAIPAAESQESVEKLSGKLQSLGETSAQVRSNTQQRWGPFNLAELHPLAHQCFHWTMLCFLKRQLAMSLTNDLDARMKGFKLWKAIELSAKNRDIEPMQPEGPAGQKRDELNAETATKIFMKADALSNRLLTEQQSQSSPRNQPVVQLNPKLHAAVQSLLSNPKVFYANARDLKFAEGLLEKLTRTERVPEGCSYEALVLLRNAYDRIDIFNSEAVKNKIRAKYAYLLMLAGNVIVVAINTFSSDDIGKGGVSFPVLFFCVFNSLIIALITFFNPLAKWKALRDAALSLESEVFMFRARTGAYTCRQGVFSDSTDADAQRTLTSVIRSITDSIFESGDVASTAFFGQDATSESTHHQHKENQNMATRKKNSGLLFSSLSDKPARKVSPEPKFTSIMSERYRSNESMRHSKFEDRDHEEMVPEFEDDYHSPLNNMEYIRLRLNPAIDFYKGRLPRVYRRNVTSQVLLLTISGTSVVLAACGLGPLVSIIAAFACSLTAWSEFTEYGKKLRRYSGVVKTLENHLVWWDSLSSSDRALAANSSHLVEVTEATLSVAREVWSSAARIQAQLSHATAGDRKKKLADEEV